MSMIELPHKNGTVVLDEEDHNKIIKDDLYIVVNKSTKAHNRVVYQVLLQNKGPHKDRKRIRLHRYILGITDKSSFVDHVNNNELDNRKSNMRVCNRAQNRMNARKFTGQYKGVHKSKKSFVAILRVNKKTIRCGYFKYITQAAMAYDNAARRYFGEFAKPNFETILSYKKALREEQSS